MPDQPQAPTTEETIMDDTTTRALHPAEGPTRTGSGEDPAGLPEVQAEGAEAMSADPGHEDPQSASALRPAEVPEKFWDALSGQVRTEALLRSYRELERKLGQMLPRPAGEGDVEARTRLLRELGLPERPEDYTIAPPSELITPDPELHRHLHQAGFTQAQAQLVYDLAAERLVPMVEQAVGEIEHNRQAERLAEHFGGKDAWREVARQIKAWAGANLSPEVFEALSASHDGVLVMHRMMQAEEPPLLQRDGDAGSRLDEPELRAMMRDPRYWREREPAFVAKVTEGFRRLYPN